MKYVKRYKLSLVLSILMSILFSVFSALSIYLTIPLLKTLFIGEEQTQSTLEKTDITSIYGKLQSYFENLIFSAGKEQTLLVICILILIAFLLKNITGFYSSIFMQYVEKGVLRDLRNEIYFRINSLSLRYFTKEKTGNLISRMTNDINSIQSGISAAFSSALKEPLLIIIFLILAVSISWQMTIIALLVFPVTVLIISKIGSSLKRRSIRVQQKLSDIISIISESVYGAKVIRSFRAEKYKNALFENESDEHYRLIMKSAYASEMTSPITEYLSVIAGVIIIWFGGREILVTNSLKPEEFLGFLFIIFQIITPIKNLGTINNRIQESAASGERIFEIIDQPIEIEEKADAVEKKDFEDSIILKDVSFSYNAGKPILEKINLEIKKSEVVAIVGPSGVGKSTFADLIGRFYDVTDGEILIDGIGIKNIRINSLRNLIGIVPQETILFNDTIRNNIIFGLEGVTEEDLINACKFANAYNFIMESENELDTIAGERGLKLSGGEKQRIAIARALLRNPKILILDEATSSLDTESEHLVQEAIDKLMHNRTSIVIAHRLSTVREADKIAVLENGKITQTGTHDELINQQNGLYKKLYDLQFN